MINIFSFRVRKENNPFFADIYLRQWDKPLKMSTQLDDRKLSAAAFGWLYILWGVQTKSKEVKHDRTN